MLTKLKEGFIIKDDKATVIIKLSENYLTLILDDRHYYFNSDTGDYDGHSIGENNEKIENVINNADIR